MTLSGLLIIAAVALFAIMLLSGWYTRVFTDRVRRRLEWIEEIFDTGNPPVVWHCHGRATRRDVQRLDKLIGYLAKTTLVVDEATREEVASRLSEVREQWHSQEIQSKLNGKD